jgi:hypothetical protein
MRSTFPIIGFPKNPAAEKSANDQDGDSRPQRYRRRHGGRDSASAYPQTIKPSSIIIEAKNEGTTIQPQIFENFAPQFP